MARRSSSIPPSDAAAIQRVVTVPADASHGVADEATDDDIHRISLVFLCILALAVGIVSGFGAIVFRDLIGLIHNALFLGQFATHYDANVFTPPSPWGAWIILVPVLALQLYFFGCGAG
jgi:chloride channel protein, CIC family